MQKRIIIPLLGALLLCSALFIFEQGNVRSLARSNVIVLLVDTLRHDQVGNDSNGDSLTPFLDGLADDHIRFERAVAPCSWTKPSVASLFTGFYPGRHGAVRQPWLRNARGLKGKRYLDPVHTTLAERLKAEGYQTAAFVTNPNITSSLCFDQGFDTFVQPAGPAEQLLDQARTWIRERESKGPFFVYLHLIDPHSPYSAPEDFVERFVRQEPVDQAPLTCLGTPYEILLWQRQYDAWQEDHPGEPFRFDYERALTELMEKYPEYASSMEKLTVDDLRSAMYLDFHGNDDPRLVNRVNYLMALYQAEIAYIDHTIERFYSDLAAEGVMDDTVFVFTSDHGEAFMEHGLVSHGGNVHAEVVNVPLIMRLPPNAGSFDLTVKEVVSLVDLYPTMVDMLGLTPPRELDGSSLWPLLQGDQRRVKRSVPVLTELIDKLDDHVAAVVDDRKLIRTKINDQEEEWDYYDLDADPGEQNALEPGTDQRSYQTLKQTISTWLGQRTLGTENRETDIKVSDQELEHLRQLGYM